MGAVNRPDLEAVTARPENVFVVPTYQQIPQQGSPLLETVVFGGKSVLSCHC